MGVPSGGKTLQMRDLRSSFQARNVCLMQTRRLAYWRLRESGGVDPYNDPL